MRKVIMGTFWFGIIAQHIVIMATFANSTEIEPRDITATSDVKSETTYSLPNPSQTDSPSLDAQSTNFNDRLRIYNTAQYSYNWSSRFDDRDPDRLFTIVVSATEWFPFQYEVVTISGVGGPIVSAIEEFLRISDRLREYYYDLIFLNDGCFPNLGIPKHLDLAQEVDADVVLVMACSQMTKAFGYFLNYKDIALISSHSNDDTLANKNEYFTLIRMGFTVKYMPLATYHLLQEYNWDRVGSFIVRSEECYALQAIYDLFIEKQILMSEWASFEKGILSDDAIRVTVTLLKHRARVILLCTSFPNLLRVIDEFDRQGMMTSDYVYLFVYPILEEAEERKPWSFVSADAETIEKRKRAFQFIKMVTLPTWEDEKYQQARNEYHVRTQQPPLNNDVAGAPPIKHPSILTMYDVAYSWLSLVNQSLADNTDPRSGRNLFQKARNMTFTGAAGDVAAMDDSSDRISPYVVWQYIPGQEEIKIVLQLTPSNPEGQRVAVVEGEAIVWGTSDGQPPPDEPACGFYEEFCQKTTTSSRDVILIICACSAAVVVIAIYLITMYIRKRKYEDEIQRMTWKINLDEITFNDTRKSGSMVHSALSMNSHPSGVGIVEGQIFTLIATYKGATVAVKKTTKASGFTLDKAHLIKLKQVKDMSHENVNSFIGACIDGSTVHVLWTYCPKGGLQDVLENDDINLDAEFKLSLVCDLLNGMKYIHESVLGCHGQLKSSCCLIDSRWALKVANFGLTFFKESTEPKSKDLLWTAPELLRNDDTLRKTTQKADVYSFGIILQEIVCRAQPFIIQDTDPAAIIAKVKQGCEPPFRPDLSLASNLDVQPELLDIMNECWQEDPSERPHFAEIKKRIMKSNKGRKMNIVDNMVQKLEKYANNLEEIVAKRTEELMIEKKKTDQLLYRMLPKVVAEKLKLGDVVPPEFFDVATVYFSDIVGFTSLSSESTPMQVVDLLNDLYTCFDDIIALHDVYKVETIGDAYMCVSGIPTRNGNRHSAEIANMALALRTATGHFVIRHKPGRSLRIRIGIHTGPCAAGVVGLTMPRYCLFGDTVNTASRMESNSIEMKIHLSESTQESLETVGGYDIQCRGEIEVKGKGKVTTYWLEGKHNE